MPPDKALQQTLDPTSSNLRPQRGYGRYAPCWRPQAVTRIVAKSLLVIACMAVAGCCAPYNCEQAVAGRKLYEPTIIALEDFKAANGEYPVNLMELVPTFIETVPPREPNESALYPQYHRADNSYVLQFRYYGPGANHCFYSPESLWFCDGYY